MTELSERERRDDERIRGLAGDYNRPGDPPRERMWAAIQARRQAGERLGPSRSTSVRRLRWTGWITGVAAVLALGIAIGRLTTGGGAPNPSSAVEIPMAAAPDPASRPPTALAVATTQHLTRVETFLTDFRAAGPEGQFTGQARELLTSTRLLLDRQAVSDVRTRTLLEDLELILVQIVQLGASERTGEVDLIHDGLAERQVMPRLRTAIPAGPARSPGAS